jgi:type III pantothenate kinase
MPSSETLLTIDIGNTTIAAAVFRGNTIVSKGRIPTAAGKPSSYYKGIRTAIGLKALGGVRHVAVSSVVPALDPAFIALAKKRFGARAFFISHRNCGIRIDYAKPPQVGADRLANAAAGKTLYGAPVIIVDFGTAITFDCIDRRGAYSGGIILPGAELTAAALYEHTAKLPLVDPFRKPRGIIGKNTVDAIASGLYYGMEGAVDRILRGLKKDMQCDKIVFTGGYAGSMRRRIARRAALDPDLTLKGIRIIWELNRKRGGKGKEGVRS